MFLRKPITQAERGTVGGGGGDKTMRDASTYEVLRKYFQKNWLLTNSNLQVNSINKEILVSINIIDFPGLPKVLLTTMIIFDFTTCHFYSFHYYSHTAHPFHGIPRLACRPSLFKINLNLVMSNQTFEVLTNELLFASECNDLVVKALDFQSRGPVGGT